MDVKEMSGTEGFLDFPVNISKCQNEESVLDLVLGISLSLKTYICTLVTPFREN